MAQLHLEFVYPMFSLVLLTAVVAFIMVSRRFQSVKSGQVPIDYFRLYNFDVKAEKMMAASRHFTNLFEVPVLFYVACLICMVLPESNVFLFGFSWSYVLARILHAYIHLTTNRIRLRMRAFISSYFILMCLWIMIFVLVLKQHLQ